MGEWKRVKLGNLIRIKHGYAFPGTGITSNDNGKVLVTPGNFNIGGGFKESGKKFFSGEFPPEYCLAGGDLIVTMTDLSKASDTLGYSAIVPTSSDNQYLHNQRIGLVSIVDEMADRNFIYWLMRTPSYHQEVVAGASGTTVKHTSPSRIYDVEVNIPPLPTQRRIAAVLGALDDKIEVNRKICENLEAQAQVLFKAWFVDFEPFGGKRPEGWKEVGLPEVFYFQEGPGIRNWQYVAENGVRFINIRCIVNGDIWVDSANMISEEEANGKYSHFLLQKNDIVMSCSGTLGRYAIVRKDHLPLCLNTSVIRFRPKNGFADFSWLYGYLGSEEFLSQQKALANGSVQANFGPTHLKNMKVMLPDAVTREKYHQAIYSSIQKAQTVREENKTLAAMRDALLPKLMSGELAVEKVAV